MLFDAREFQPSADHSPEPSTEDLDMLQRAEKFRRKHTKRVLGAQALILTATVAITAYWGDVRNNKEIQASSTASVNIHEAPIDARNDSSALVFFNGFGTYDADEIAETFSPGLKQHLDGESWSVSYGNAPLNTKKIAQHIIDLAEERSTPLPSASVVRCTSCETVLTKAIHSLVSKT